MSTRRRDRRRFLHTSSTTVLGLPAIIPQAALGSPGRPGANEQIRIGLIGVGIRGRFLIAHLPSEARVAALSDWYVPRMEQTLHPSTNAAWAKMLSDFVERDADRCATYEDYRRLLDRPDLDAVMIATPDHHHMLAAMLACQAGLDVYVEKPLSLTIAEGRKLVQAVKRYNRVCQVGSQNRSMETNRYGCRLIRTGGIGEVSRVDVCNYTGPLTYENLPREAAPAGCQWDLFCGPTHSRPYHWRLWQKDERRWEARVWRGWDMWRSYSGHLMTNWGAHSVDMVQLALGMDHTGPVEIWPKLDVHAGPRRTCPVAARYADGTELHFTMNFSEDWVFHGSLGKAFMRRNSFSTDPPELMTNPPDLNEQRRIWGVQSVVAVPHVQNWLDCIKTRAEPNAPVEVGHRSVTVCHLAGIARELGRMVRWDPRREIFPDDEEANALLDRPRRKGWELPDVT